MSLIQRLGKNGRGILAALALPIAASLGGCSSVSVDRTPNAYGNTDPAQKAIDGIFDLATGKVFRPEPKPTVIVYNTPAKTDEFNIPGIAFAANGYAGDKNHNGAVDYPAEFINPGKSRFSQNENVLVGFYRLNGGPTLAVKKSIIDIRKQKEIETGEYQLSQPNTFLYSTYSPQSITPGLYKCSFTDDKNHVLGEVQFEVVEDVKVANK